MDAQNYISLRETSPEDGRRMSLQETIVVLSVIGRFIGLRVDIIRTTCVLEQLDLISPQQRQRLLDKYAVFEGSEYEKLQMYIQDMFATITFENLISVLRIVGCSKLADVLTLKKHSEMLVCVRNTETPNSELMHHYYNTVKELLSSGKFPNKRAALQNITDDIRRELQQARVRAARQRALDKLAVITCVRTNCHSRLGERTAILAELRHVLDDCTELDSTSVDIIYSISMCMAYKTFGYLDSAKRQLEEAKAICFVNDNSFFKLLTWHMLHLLSRTVYVRDPTDSTLHESTIACHLAMSFVSPEPEVVRQPWTRTFAVFTALSLLLIGQEFEIPNQSQPTEQQRRDAEDVLLSAKRSTKTPWNNRREMMYNMCMARIKEKTETSLAVSYCEQAQKFAELGSYSMAEKNNIASFIGQLQPQLAV